MKQEKRTTVRATRAATVGDKTVTDNTVAKFTVYGSSDAITIDDTVAKNILKELLTVYQTDSTESMESDMEYCA